MVYIEIGNSSVKAVENPDEPETLLFSVPVQQPVKLSAALHAIADGERVLLSSVRKDITTVIRKQNHRLNIHEIRSDRLGAISLAYETPETLGVDRVLACAGAVYIGGEDAVVVDAGTACTVDWMTHEYRFMGGVIMPGLPMLRYGVKNLTPELPGVEEGIPGGFPGHSTKDAIRIGLNGGFIHAITGFVEQYRGIAASSKLYVTGGNGMFVARELSPDFKCEFHRNLVFTGMKAYLEMNQPQF